MKRYLYFILHAIVIGHFAFAIAEDVDFLDEPPAIDDPSVALASLEGEPNAVVNQTVNIITGDYIDFQTDLVVPGVEPITIQRFYSSSDLQISEFRQAWKFNHDISLKASEFNRLTLVDSFGAHVPFVIDEEIDKRCTRYRVSSKTLRKGVTNTVSRKLSGSTHLRNKFLINDEKSVYYTVQNGSGTKYEFTKPQKKEEKPVTFIHKPNGILFHYLHDKNANLTHLKIQLKMVANLSMWDVSILKMA